MFNVLYETHILGDIEQKLKIVRKFCYSLATMQRARLSKLQIWFFTLGWDPNNILKNQNYMTVCKVGPFFMFILTGLNVTCVFLNLASK
jgi:hypothetical protein